MVISRSIPPTSGTWHIGQVAREIGLSVHGIRFYERKGLVKTPLRSEGRFRIFSDQDVRDLKFIRRGQELGFSLAEIRELLVLRRSSPHACSHVRDLLARALSRVEPKVADMLRLQHELKAALRKCNRDLKRFGTKVEKACPVLQELEQPAGKRSTGRRPEKSLESRLRSRVHHNGSPESPGER